MYRISFARVVGQVSRRRLASVCRARGKSLCRSYSASTGGQGSAQSENPLHWTLGAAAALSAIYYVYPFEKKPKQEVTTESEPEPETKAESGESAEEDQEQQEQQQQQQQEEQPEQHEQPEQPETADEGTGNSEPTKENTIASTDSLESEKKDIRSDEELQKMEEAQLEPTNQEAEREGAYNPDTGEINWDCPCLGGMAQGPCGEEFKLAFSCFVFSEAEPKGIDCVEKFQGMQECFRKYPEHYAEQIKDEDEAVAARDEKIEAAVTGEEAKQGTKTEGNSENKAEIKAESPEKSEESAAGASNDEGASKKDGVVEVDKADKSNE